MFSNNREKGVIAPGNSNWGNRLIISNEIHASSGRSDNTCFRKFKTRLKRRVSNAPVCPECGGGLYRTGYCLSCVVCGWGGCD
jgi:hypothetical protein